MPAIDKELREKIEGWNDGTWRGLPYASNLIERLISALEAAAPVADAVEWCCTRLPDVEFNDFGDGNLVRVRIPINLDDNDWWEAEAPTFVEAVAALAKRRGE